MGATQPDMEGSDCKAALIVVMEETFHRTQASKNFQSVRRTKNCVQNCEWLTIWRICSLRCFCIFPVRCHIMFRVICLFVFNISAVSAQHAGQATGQDVCEHSSNEFWYTAKWWHYTVVVQWVQWYSTFMHWQTKQYYSDSMMFSQQAIMSVICIFLTVSV